MLRGSVAIDDALSGGAHPRTSYSSHLFCRMQAVVFGLVARVAEIESMSVQRHSFLEVTKQGR